MPLLRCNGRLILFVHVPKTGGTSVEAYLRRKGPVGLFAPERAPEGLRVTPQHLHRAALDALVPAEMVDARFAVLRDPMARLMSEYRWRKARHGKVVRRRVGGLVRFGRRLAPALANRGLSFDEWVAVTLDDFARDPFLYDNHIRPQSAFVAPGDRLFRLEDGLEPVFRWIDTATGTEASEVGPRLKSSGGGEAVAVSEATRARVRAFYAEDYALLERLAGGQDGASAS